MQHMWYITINLLIALQDLPTDMERNVSDALICVTHPESAVRNNSVIFMHRRMMQIRGWCLESQGSALSSGNQGTWNLSNICQRSTAVGYIVVY